MPPKTRLPVIAVTGLAFEARIGVGPGVVTICGSRSEQLAAAVAATIARGCQGIVSFGIAGGLALHLKPGSRIGNGNYILDKYAAPLFYRAVGPRKFSISVHMHHGLRP